MNTITKKEQYGPDNPSWSGGKSSYDCPRCGNTFEAYASERARGGAKYCSATCGYEAKKNRVLVKCENCGASREKTKSDCERSAHHFCSDKCHAQWIKEHRSGENSPLCKKEQNADHVKKRFQSRARSIQKTGHITPKGYMSVWSNGVRMLEHRVVAEKALGRPIRSHEVVHHINGIKNDNRNCNLMICDKGYHHWLERKMSNLYKLEHFGHL